jgi:hypothetical protein
VQPRKAILVEGMEDQLRKLGLLDQIDHVLRVSAPVTHEKGNRRYHHLILDVQGDTILAIFDVRRASKLPSKANPGTFIAWDPCEACVDGSCGKCVKGYLKVERKL